MAELNYNGNVINGFDEIKIFRKDEDIILATNVNKFIRINHADRVEIKGNVKEAVVSKNIVLIGHAESCYADQNIELEGKPCPFSKETVLQIEKETRVVYGSELLYKRACEATYDEAKKIAAKAEQEQRVIYISGDVLKIQVRNVRPSFDTVINGNACYVSSGGDIRVKGSIGFASCHRVYCSLDDNVPPIDYKAKYEEEINNNPFADLFDNLDNNNPYTKNNRDKWNDFFS